jgi:TDG/mug DNA glycosylase family protein
MAERETLPDIPPQKGGVLLVGINPALPSVAAGHYYQGRLGQRLWRRLARVGLLSDAEAGKEDEAFARDGNGLTDLVKRPTATAADLRTEELDEGIDALRSKIRKWKPGLVLFAFRPPAERLLGHSVRPGPGPSFEGVPTFLLSGPYAATSETERIDDELGALLEKHAEDGALAPDATSQRVTRTDIENGRVRFPRAAKSLFPRGRTYVDVAFRGSRTVARWDPRFGPDQERSGVLLVGRALSEKMGEGEVLNVRRSPDGAIELS